MLLHVFKQTLILRCGLRETSDSPTALATAAASSLATVVPFCEYQVYKLTLPYTLAIAS